MGEMTREGSSVSDTMDLSQFYQIFFEEAAENLERMEQLLLTLDPAQPDDEELNAIFRCAHSIKGGAATFGFSDVAELTHQMETLLDKLRRHELLPTAQMVDVLLESGDVLKALLARHQGTDVSVPETAGLVRRIADLAQGKTTDTAGAPMLKAPAEPVAVVAVAPVVADGPRLLHLTIGPLSDPSQADEIPVLFREITGLGSLENLPDEAPGLRCFKVTTTSTDSDMMDLFTFHVPRDKVSFKPFEAAPAAAPLAEAAPVAAVPAAAEPAAGYGFFDGAPGVPVAGPVAAEHHEVALAAKPAKVEPKAAAAAAAPEASTLRVAVDKVDQLINLVGELVITQAMLAQHSQSLDPVAHQQLVANLTDLDRNTRDLQESVMSIRMIPMSLVFNRFPRMLRDLASKLGKKVEFVTHGEATELDKGLVEKITDPLTHLVRNSCDHGIELPHERIAAGKVPHGTITLSASHQGSSIVIEVRDDGRGMSREKILKKAREQGIPVNDQMPDADVWQLIFAPGFSTAEVVTDVSGRGVGMDVVKRNISSLGGTVEIESSEGYGMRVAVRLPLTLAIMDGMSVSVSDEVYILPLASVVESFQIKADSIRTVGQAGRLVEVRNEFMPVINLEELFTVPRFDMDKSSRIMVVVEAEGMRAALMVDELLGQHQVVVKNLEANYRKVPDVSAATILGDGRVALILDVNGLVRRSRH
jgi:two-component system chemotaxis sensor kinase CheA